MRMTSHTHTRFITIHYTWRCHRSSTGHLPKPPSPPRPDCPPSLEVITLFMPIRFEWIGSFVWLQFPRPGIRLAVAWLSNRGPRLKEPKSGGGTSGQDDICSLTVNSRCLTFENTDSDQSRLKSVALGKHLSADILSAPESTRI